MRPTVVLALMLSMPAMATDVLILSAGAPTTDQALVDSLTALGHTATIGPNYWEFPVGYDLSPYQVVYLQGNGNWIAGDIPLEAQGEILDFVQQGGGLICSEWVVWMRAARGVFQVLGTNMPVEPSASFRNTATITMTRRDADSFVANGLPSAFDMPLTSFSGTETVLVPKQFATVFYDSDWIVNGTPNPAVVGWDVCGGRVVNFATTNGIDQVQDPEFKLLLSNVIVWSTRSRQDGVCPADIATPCGDLNFFDVSQFLARYGSSDPRADYTGDGQLNFFDVAAYLSIFNEGCFK